MVGIDGLALLYEEDHLKMLVTQALVAATHNRIRKMQTNLARAIVHELAEGMKG